VTAPTIAFASTGRHSARQESILLVEAAKRGDLQRLKQRRWPAFLLNGRENTGIRTAVTRLLADGVLVIADHDAVLSDIKPASSRGA
jgi:hypothetical protein